MTRQIKTSFSRPLSTPNLFTNNIQVATDVTDTNDTDGTDTNDTDGTGTNDTGAAGTQQQVVEFRVFTCQDLLKENPSPDQLINFYEDNKDNNSLALPTGCNYPCVYNGVPLNEQQKRAIAALGFNLINCPESEPETQTISISCDQIGNYEPTDLANKIKNGTHEIESGCLYPCFFKGTVLSDTEKEALRTVGVQIDESSCPCPDGFIRNSNGECEKIQEQEEPDPVQSRPICEENKIWDSERGECVDINPCPPGFVWDPNDPDVPCKEAPECDESQGLRRNPDTGNCERICAIGEYWDGSRCLPIPACGEGTVFDEASGKCIPAYDRVTCGPGQELINGQCVTIEDEQAPPPQPPNINLIINFPIDSGNPIVEDPDPENSTGNASFLQSQDCEDLPPPPPPPVIIDPNRPIQTIQSSGRYIYVIQNKVGLGAEYINSPYRAPGVDDTLRATTGYFWYFDERFRDKPLLAVYRDLNERRAGLTRYLENVVSNGFTYNKEQPTVRLDAIRNEFALRNIQSFPLNTEMRDFVFSVNMAIDELEDDDAIYSFSKQSVYNYYIGSYEKLLASPQSPSLYDLPNYYLIEEQQNSSQYYENYVSEWIDSPQTQTEKTRNIMFGYGAELSNNLEENLIPFYNKISFDLEKDKRKIFDYLKDQEKQKETLNILMFNMFLLEQDREIENLIESYSYQDKNEMGNSGQNRDLVSVLYDDFLSFLDNESTRFPYEVRYQENSNKITTINLEYENFSDFRGAVDQEYYYDGPIGSLNSILSVVNRRTFIEILKGKENYSETLFYKIEKYEEGNSQAIQSIWVPNDEKDVFEFIDTQIRYNTNYTYLVKSYKYVLGNKYKYTNREQVRNSPGAEGVSYSFNLTNEIELCFIATEYARIPGIVIDKPPPAPEIDVIPYKDNDEKVLVLFNPSSVEYKRMPVSFSDEEREFYERIQNYQRSQDGKITFGGDDKTKKYYVYRIEEHPSSYDDFADALYAEIEPECNCTTAEYIQDLEANKKYYFVFRSVDVHGHISYPTQPFLVELINEGGTTFLDFRGVDFINKEYKSLTKGAKRFIHVKPNLQQSLLRITDPDRASALTAIERGQYDLGQEELENRIWGKNFKLKIKSKNTKKEINIKFKFVKKENKDLIRNLEESCE